MIPMCILRGIFTVLTYQSTRIAGNDNEGLPCFSIIYDSGRSATKKYIENA